MAKLCGNCGGKVSDNARFCPQCGRPVLGQVQCVNFEGVANRSVILHEVEGLPDWVLQEVLDFVRFLKTKKGQELLETALLSESALQKDWLQPGEDNAWRDL